jgi:hypothetical protein
MNCDPPTIACSEFVTSGAVALIGTADFQWDNQCDRCGARETLLTPTMLPLGHMTVFDHVCDAVPMKIKIMRFKRAERVLLVERQPRRQPKRIPRSKRKM